MIKNTTYLTILAICCMMWACESEMDKFVSAVNAKAKEIDTNRRVEIIEDDHHEGDTIYKIRGYYMDGKLLKMIGITRTPHLERDDYFYFDHYGSPLFTGHLINHRDEHDAAEYKYYYKDKKIAACMFWEDHYTPGRQFPHEHFEYFQPNLDSLENEESNRLAFFQQKLAERGIEIQKENENLEANSDK